MRIVVSGYIASFPIAGFFWHHVGFAIGFHELGHDVWYIEDSGDEPWGWDTLRNEPDPSLRAGAAFLGREMPAVGFADRWALRHIPTGRVDGMSQERVDDVLATADVFVNLSCTAPPRSEYLRIPHRLAIDTDPVFTQIRIARGDPRRRWIPDAHTRLFTFGRPPLPAQQHEWIPTRQALPTRQWRHAPLPRGDAPFTTIASWEAYPPEEWNGLHYGGKGESFTALHSLPASAHATLRVALGGRGSSAEARDTLAAAGWEVDDAVAVSATCGRYRRFIEDSAGEIGIAKHGYVASRSGWFSERTCCYLAAGRPAVVMDTGLDWLPTGTGLLSFTDAAGAVAAMDEVRANPRHHADAARRIAEDHFRADRVCQALLDAL